MEERNVYLECKIKKSTIVKELENLTFLKDAKLNIYIDGIKYFEYFPENMHLIDPIDKKELEMRNYLDNLYFFIKEKCIKLYASKKSFSPGDICICLTNEREATDFSPIFVIKDIDSKKIIGTQYLDFGKVLCGEKEKYLDSFKKYYELVDLETKKLFINNVQKLKNIEYSDISMVCDGYEKYEKQHAAICEKYEVDSIEELYDKAIDDFAKALIKMYERYDIDDVFENNDTYSYTRACYIFEQYIEEIAKQLKNK